MKNSSFLKKAVCFVLAFFLISGVFTPFLSLAAEVSNTQNISNNSTALKEPKQNNTEIKDEATNDEATKTATDEEKSEESASFKKDETVYVNLNPDGSVREQIITDKIHSESGAAVVDDKSNLKDIEIIKGGELQKNEGGNLTWKLDGKDLYYRGKTDKKLPFDMQIKYFLDGKETPAQKLAGKSGELKITLDFKNKLIQKRMINGKSCEIYSPMVIAAVLMMPDETFENVVAEDCKVTTSGDSTTVAITSMPGLYESFNLENSSIDELKDLDFPESFTITANVTNFEMSPIAITAKIGFPDEEDEIDTEFIDDMQEDLNEVKRIKDSFESMDDDRALRDMLTDDEKIDELKSLVDDIDELLDLNKDFIDALPQYVTRKNVDTLEKITDRMKEFDLRYLKDFDYHEDHDNAKLSPQTGKGIQAALELADGFNWNAAYTASQHMEMLKSPDNIKTIGTEARKIAMELKTREENGIEGSSLDKAFLNLLENDDPEIQMLVMALLNPTESKQIAMLKAGIKGDLHANEENIELGKNLIQYYKDPYLRTLVSDAQYLYDDFLELYPTISKLKHDFEKENMKESFRQSPETVDALIRIKNNLEENSDITDNLRKLTEDENVEKTKDIIETLDNFDKDKLIDDYSKKADDLQDMVLRKDLLRELADENKIHTDYDESMDTDFKFILKTDEIEIPEEDEEVREEAVKKESQISKFFKNLFK